MNVSLILRNRNKSSGVRFGEYYSWFSLNSLQLCFLTKNYRIHFYCIPCRMRAWQQILWNFDLGVRLTGRPEGLSTLDDTLALDENVQLRAIYNLPENCGDCLQRHLNFKVSTKYNTNRLHYTWLGKNISLRRVWTNCVCPL